MVAVTSRTRLALGLVSVSALAVASAGVSLGDVAARAPVDDTVSSHQGAPIAKAFRGAIDTHDRGAVRRAYNTRLAPNLRTPIRWTGSNRRCRAGHMSARAMRATLESVNFVRAMGGLGPVSFNPRLSAKAQKAALIMSANKSLSHVPPRSWRCWTRAGAEAAGHSNLALSYPRITAGGAIMQYMDDTGSNNKVAGHRRWIMYPPTLKMGNGTTTTSNALWIFGGASSASRPNPDWVSWPTTGFFPAPLEPHGRWSLSSGASGARFGQARVHVETASGVVKQVHAYRVASGYGMPTIVFRVKSVPRVGTLRVTVRGIRLPGRTAPVSHSYTVRLFSP
jgi:uncharacterized protein YkwD